MAIEISDKDWAELLRERVSAKDPVFQFWVGRSYEVGHGIEQNYAEAAKWYKLAADQGHAVAQNNLAVCYTNGKGVAKDDKEALRLYNLAVAQGFWCAFENLGDMYRDGTFVEQDRDKALEHYKKALANAGYELAPASIAEKERIQAKIDEINAAIAEEERIEQERAKAAAEVEAGLARIADRKQVFISYARKDMLDIDYVDELRPHLNMKTTEVNWWDDTQIKPGEKWDEKIQEALSKTKIAILMVSANFFNSKYVWRKELPKILEAAEGEGATILWLPVSFFDCEDTPIMKYQAVTDPSKPLVDCTRAQRVLHYIYQTLIIISFLVLLF